MGNSTIDKINKRFNKGNYQWLVLSATPYCTKVRDKLTHLKAEKYKLEMRELERDLQVFLMRNKNPRYMVAVYDIVQDEVKSVCTVSHQVSIIIEQINYRLSDLGAISFQEGLYVIRSVLRACEIIKKNQIGFYMPDDNNICFNNYGECKFWINQNLFRAQPTSNRKISQKEFVLLLWEMIGERINQENDFFQTGLEGVKDYRVQSVRQIVDRVFERSMVGIPSLIHLQKELNGSQFKNSSQIKNNSEIKLARSRGREDKKVSLSGFGTASSRKNVREELTGVKIKDTKEKIESENKSGSRKVSLHKDTTYQLVGQTRPKGSLKMMKTNTNGCTRTGQIVKIDPYFSIKTTQTMPTFNSPSQKTPRTLLTPILKFSYKSPVSSKHK